MARVGSRATCSPPPTDTDEDFIVLVENMTEARKHLIEMGFETETDSGKIDDYARMSLETGYCFVSLRFGDLNYIVTDSVFFFERFLTGAYICRMLNVMDKEQRIMVHAAIRGATYATRYCPEFKPDMLRMYAQRRKIGETEAVSVYDKEIDYSLEGVVIATVERETFRRGGGLPF